MRTPAIASLLVLLAACTSSEPEDAVVGQELLRPTPPVVREGIRSDQTDPSRTGDCAQLSGQAMRDCLERAQYQPRNAQGLPGEPATLRQDPEQVELDREGQPRPRQTPEPVDDRSGSRQ